MQVEPVAPSPITAAAAEAKGKDDPEAQHSSPGAKMHAVIDKVKDKAKKLKSKIKGKKTTGPESTDPEHEGSGGEDEDESDQSSPYQNQQSDHPELNKGFANRDISGDKNDATPGATAPGTGVVQDPESESADTTKFDPQSDSVEKREVDPRPDKFDGTPGKDAITTGAVQDPQSETPQNRDVDPQFTPAESREVDPQSESAEAEQLDPHSESAETREVDPRSTSAETDQQFDPKSESADTEKYEDAEGDKGYKDRAYDGLTTARDTVAAAPAAAAGALGYKAYEQGEEKPSKGTEEVDPQFNSAESREGDPQAESAQAKQFDPQSESAETREFDPQSTSAETDQQFDPKSESAGTEEYEDAEGDKGYKDRAYEGVSTARDTVAGASAAAAGALGYKAYEQGEKKPLNEGEEKPSVETGEVDPQINSAESREVDPQSESAEAKQFDPQFESAETREFDPRSTSDETDPQFDPKSESAGTEKYEDAEGDKGYKDRGYEGVATARDTVAGAAAGAAGALGYKAYEQGEEKPGKDTGEVDPQLNSAESREVDPLSKSGETSQFDPQSESAATSEVDPRSTSTETEQFDPKSESADTAKGEGGDKGYKDRAYEGVTTAKDTLAGVPAAAAGALGYKAYGQGEEKPSNEGEDVDPQVNSAESREVVPNSESPETDKYEDAEGQKGYQDRAYEGLTTDRDTIAGAPAAAAGALGYKGYGQGEEKPLNEGDPQLNSGESREVNPQSESAAETTQFDPQSESAQTDQYEDGQGGKGYKDRAYEGVSAAKDTLAGASAAAAGALGYGQGEEKPGNAGQDYPGTEGELPSDKSQLPAGESKPSNTTTEGESQPTVVSRAANTVLGTLAAKFGYGTGSSPTTPPSVEKAPPRDYAATDPDRSTD